MIRWQGQEQPVNEIVWTKRGLRVRTAARWVTATIIAIAMAAAMTHKYGVS
jgi:hypothetical protein